MKKLSTLFLTAACFLATHLRALEEAGYVAVQKQFVGRKPNTTYSATQAGQQAFSDHLNALEAFIKTM